MGSRCVIVVRFRARSGASELVWFATQMYMFAMNVWVVLLARYCTYMCKPYAEYLMLFHAGFSTPRLGKGFGCSSRTGRLARNRSLTTTE